MSGEGHGHRWLGMLVLMMVMMLVLGLWATRHLLQVLLDLAGTAHPSARVTSAGSC
jgi:hypothetical protein